MQNTTLVRWMRRRLPTDESRRLVWVGIVWVLDLAIIAFGMGYLTKAIVTTDNPAYAAFLRVPGRFTTHGVIQVIIGLILFVGLAPTLVRRPANTEYLRHVIAVPYAVYCGITALAFLCAPLAGGTKNPAWVAWCAFCGIALLLATVPPPLMVGRPHDPSG